MLFFGLGVCLLPLQPPVPADVKPKDTPVSDLQSTFSVVTARLPPPYSFYCVCVCVGGRWGVACDSRQRVLLHCAGTDSCVRPPDTQACAHAYERALPAHSAAQRFCSPQDTPTVRIMVHTHTHAHPSLPALSLTGVLATSTLFFPCEFHSLSRLAELFRSEQFSILSLRRAFAGELVWRLHSGM